MSMATLRPDDADEQSIKKDRRLYRLGCDEAQVRIVLRPIAPPAALGLAGFASSTIIVATWIARWWGDAESPIYFFPFVDFFGGLAQFIAGLYGFHARDTLVSVVNTMYGAFWLGLALLYAFVAMGYLKGRSIYEHFPELAIWFVPLMMFTWTAAIASLSRDTILFLCLICLSIADTIALCLFAHNPDSITAGIKAAAYFFLLSALFAWWRASAFMIQEGFNGKPWTARLALPSLYQHRQPVAIEAGIDEPGIQPGRPRMRSLSKDSQA